VDFYYEGTNFITTIITPPFTFNSLAVRRALAVAKVA
jgi:hypothetical protein